MCDSSNHNTLRASCPSVTQAVCCLFGQFSERDVFSIRQSDAIFVERARSRFLSPHTECQLEEFVSERHQVVPRKEQYSQPRKTKTAISSSPTPNAMQFQPSFLKIDCFCVREGQHVDVLLNLSEYDACKFLSATLEPIFRRIIHRQKK